jgi:hypothetical protein
LRQNQLLMKNILYSLPSAKNLSVLLIIILSIVKAQLVYSYPLDGANTTGILRLEGYRLAQERKVKGRILYPGSLQPSEKIKLNLLDQPDFQIPPPDPELTKYLHQLIDKKNIEKYGIVILDLSDKNRPRYAEINPNLKVNPGSLGKALVGLGMFQALADAYPENIQARWDILKNTTEIADKFIIKDSHVVPFWKPGDKKVIKRKLRVGDKGNLWTYLDWMLSSSSNAAAAMVQKNLMLIHHYGTKYPRPIKEMNDFLANAPRKELKRIFTEAIQDPISKNGLDITKLRQGSFFTRQGKRSVPGTKSYMTSGEMLNFLIKMEQGKLVDPHSSLALKRLLYLTDRRIRYGAARNLYGEMVYLKSGSLYSCKKEPGFTCRKYRGNRRNLMNSLAIIESIDRDPDLKYIVVLVSKVLKINSAAFHMNIGSDIHKIIQKLHPTKPKPTTTSTPLKKKISERSLQPYNHKL